MNQSNPSKRLITLISFLFLFMISFFIFCSLYGCAPTIQEKRTNYAEVIAKYSDSRDFAVKEGIVVPNLVSVDIIIMWGQPDSKSNMKTWIYKRPCYYVKLYKMTGCMLSEDFDDFSYRYKEAEITADSQNGVILYFSDYGKLQKVENYQGDNK